MEPRKDVLTQPLIEVNSSLRDILQAIAGSGHINSKKAPEAYLNVIALHNGNFPVHDHVLRMEGPKDWTVIVDDL